MVKINTDLLVNAFTDPTKGTVQEQVSNLCERIVSGDISLPLYQRDLSWTKEKYIELLNYELNGKAAVSAISINKIKNKSVAVPQISFITRELIDMDDVKYEQWSVVDGQQRISCNYKAYSDSEDFRDIVLDLGKGKFVKRDMTEKLKPNQIPVGVLYNKDQTKLTKFIDDSDAIKRDSKAQLLILQVRQKFMNYRYTLNYADDMTEEEQINWFEVLNNAGSRVSDNQMKLSRLKIENVDIYKEYTQPYQEELDDRHYNVFTQQDTRDSYPLCALNPAYEVVTNAVRGKNYCPMASDVKATQLAKLNAVDIRRCFTLSLDALKRTLDFIDDNGLEKPTRIDYINFLIGYFIFHPEELDDNHKNYLINWFNTQKFTNSSNAKRREIYSDLIDLKDFDKLSM